jgi:hypothetical protein
MSRPHRLAAPAKLVPFLSQQAVLRALAITNPEGTDLNGALRMMLDYVARWSTSTIDGAASAWFRLHWLATELNIVPDSMFDGPVLVTLCRCVAEHARQNASRAVAGGASARRNGTTVETQVRNGLFFVPRNCGVDTPALRAMLVKKMVWEYLWGACIAPDPYEMVPIYVMYHLELAAARMHPKGEDLSNIECD